uniref:Uncharacterized protein n=1 Tax=Anthurium amnicola TaxID=1678845 RepID=A0A1D1ZIU4_9ARAE
MDAVELPLATTVVSKILVPEAFGRVRESETREPVDASSVSGGASIFSAQKASSSCGSFHRDVKYPISVSEHDPISRNKRSSDGLHDNAPTSSKYKENGKKLLAGEEDFPLGPWPKYDNKQLHKKHVKMQSRPKQSRTDRADGSTNSHTIKGCTSGERDKSQVVKHKRRQESKRSDRKSMKTAAKTKFDSFMSKDSLTNSHLGVTGNNAFGAFGVKFDLLDVTKHADELSLSELLDGTYKFPNPYHDKVKKASSVNETLLLSVRKSASILTTPRAVGSSGGRKASGILRSTTCDEEEKHVEESTFSDQVQDQASISDSALHQPKDILERLVLPAAQDLDSILADSCLPWPPLKSVRSLGKASLPPFTWSLSHSGSCKPIVDTSKSATNRSTSQGRWVRIGTSSCLIGEERSCFSELNLKMDDYNGDSKPQEVGDHSPSVETLKLRDMLSYNEQFCVPHDANAITRPINMSDIPTSKKDYSVLSSYDTFNPMAMNMDSSDAYHLDSKESAVLVSMETKGIPKHEGNESNLGNKSISNPQIQEISYTEEQQTVKDLWDYNGKNCYYQFNSTIGETKHCLARSPTPAGSNSDYSPRLLAAAAILCDMARTRKRNHDTGKAIWPNIPSQAAMKVQKSRPLIGKPDGPKLAAKTSDPVTRTHRLASPEHKLMVVDDDCKTISMSNVGRGPLRWPVPTENAYSTQFGRDLVVKPTHGNSVGLTGQIPLSTRAERGYDGHRKHRSATVMTTSVSTAAIYVKDWGKGRHRRE